MKKILIIIAIIVLTIFFGSLVLTLSSYIMDLFSLLLKWIAIGMRWLGKLIDIFGFTGLF